MKVTAGRVATGQVAPLQLEYYHHNERSLAKKKKRRREKQILGRRRMLVNYIPPSPEAPCAKSQSKGLSDCTLHAN